VLFSQDAWPGLRDGSITVTFRRWKRCQAVAGHRYRTPAGIIEVERVTVVDPAKITNADARRSGAADADAVRTRLPDTSDALVYRIAFHLVDEPDPRAELARHDDLDADELATITRRLERLDRAATTGPWTATLLRLIAAHPDRRAGDLAAMLGRETAPFKLDVRKLKNLGLTLSQPIGYQLSPRGAAYLHVLDSGSR
jgi:hypothetical protein